MSWLNVPTFVPFRGQINSKLNLRSRFILLTKPFTNLEQIDPGKISISRPLKNDYVPFPSSIAILVIEEINFHCLNKWHFRKIFISFLFSYDLKHVSKVAEINKGCVECSSARIYIIFHCFYNEWNCDYWTKLCIPLQNKFLTPLLNYFTKNNRREKWKLLGASTTENKIDQSNENRLISFYKKKSSCAWHIHVQ